MKTYYKTLACLAIAAAASSTANAAITATDSFESGGLNGGTGWDATGWSTNGQASVVNTSTFTPADYSSGSVSSSWGSNAVRITDGDATDILGRTFSAIDPTTGPAYISFLFSSPTIATESDFFQMYPNGAGVNQGDADNYGAVIRNDPAQFAVKSSSGTSQTFINQNINNDATYLLVLKIEGSNHTTSLWLNPDSNTETGGTNGTRTASETGGNHFAANGINGLDFRQVFSESGDTYYIDNIQVGTSFESVTADPVPEPSSFALLAGCFGLTWVMLRRRS